MKKNLLLFLLLALLLPATATAHDFEVGGIYYNINGNEATVTYKGTYYSSYDNEYTGDVSIPATVTYNGMTYSVTSIGDDAFDGCSGLTSVNIPNFVTSIRNYAFFGCSGLTNVNIPNSVTSIGDGAFYNCSGLTSVIIPNSVTSIGDWAFNQCDNLSNIEISNSVTYIGHDAFHGTDWYNNQLDGLIYIGQIAYRYKGYYPEGTQIVIKEGTVAIAPYSFGDDPIEKKGINTPNSEDFFVPNQNEKAQSTYSGLISIDIPNSVTTIGEGAFVRCSGLTSVTIPNSVISLGDWIFEDCSGLTSINIPNSVTTIGYSAFSGCRGLTDIYSWSLTPPTIYSSTFNGCYGATLYVPEFAMENYQEADYWKDFANIDAIRVMADGINYRVLDESTASVIVNNDEGALYSGDVVIPDLVSFKGIYPFAITGIENNAFDGCYELTSVVIPNTVESIGEQAFQGCTGLRSVTIGSGVTAIGSKAFNYCNTLETVKCIGTVPPVMASSDCFSTAAYNCARLLVPRLFVESYQAADYWYKFASIEGWGSSGPGDVDGDGSVNVKDVTAMIDALLSGEGDSFYFESADLNNNGRIDVGDVTSLIDNLLYGN